jgi:hypothetical protein
MFGLYNICLYAFLVRYMLFCDAYSYFLIEFGVFFIMFFWQVAYFCKNLMGIFD